MNEIVSLKNRIKETREMTGRIRAALLALPSTIAAEAFNDSSDKDNLRELLNEIDGCVARIRELGEVDE